MPADVESYGRAAVPNPYRGLGPNHATTGANMLVDKFKRMLYIGVSGFFLHRMNFWGAILRSPHVSHEWFKLGVAGTIGTFVVAPYVVQFTRVDCSCRVVVFRINRQLQSAHHGFVETAILTIKAYVELYEGMVRRQQVNYENFKQTTHAAIFLILFTSVAFHVALWPYYRWNTPIALGLAFFGVIVQFLVVVPVWFQNLAAFAGLAFFLQEYQ